MSDYWLEIQLASFKDATCAIPGVEDATARDGTGAGDAAETNSPETNGAAAEDGNGFVGDVAREGSVDGIAKGFLDGGDGMIDFFAGLPGDVLRDGDVLRECTVTINTKYLYVAADMGLAGATLVTMSTGDVGFGGDEVAWDEGGDFAADFDDLASEFVTKDAGDGQAALRPRVPLVDMHVCTTDGGGLHLNEYITRADMRDVYQGNLCSRRRLDFEGRLHFSLHVLTTPPH